MAVVSELIREESDGTISFGDYTLGSKSKLDGFKHDGDLYKVKTYKEITKLERNGLFVYESVPGTTADHLHVSADEVSFHVEGPEDAEITLELEPEQDYDIQIDHKDAGTMSTNLGGKLTLSVELDGTRPVDVNVKRA